MQEENGMKKKLISLILVFCMVFLMIPQVFVNANTDELSVIPDDVKAREQELLENAEKIKQNALDLEKRLKEDAAMEIGIQSVEESGITYAPDNAFVKEISTAEELMAIDGERGGSYKLTKDIDLSGISWKPLIISGATIYGEGHSIKNMKIDDDYNGNLGFAVSTVVIYDVNLKDIDINLTPSKKYIITPFGTATTTIGCFVSGNIKVKDGVYRDYFYSTIYGIYNGTDCKAELDIEGGYNVCGIYNSKNCTFSGDMDIIGRNYNTYGIRNSENCTFSGNIKSSSYGNGICNSKNCTFNGTIEGGYGGIGINGSEDCIFNGGIIGSYTQTGCGGIADSKNSRFNGDVTGFGISNSEKCYLTGNINGMAIADSMECSFVGDGATDLGIKNSINCYMNGDVEHGGGISGGSNCYLVGDIASSDREAIIGGTGHFFKGNVFITTYSNSYSILSSASNCYMEGNVYQEDYYRRYGIFDCTDCVLKGNIESQYTGNSSRGREYNIYGIVDSTNCCLIGNLTHTNLDCYVEIVNRYPYYYYVTPVGIHNGQNCSMIGNVKCINKISNEPRAVGVQSCDSFLSGSVTAVAADGYTLTLNGYDSISHYKCVNCNYIGTYSEVQHHNCNDSSGISGIIQLAGVSNRRSGSVSPTVTVSPMPIPTEMPDKEATYNIRVIDANTEEPKANATVNIDGTTYITASDGMVTVTHSPTIKVLSILTEEGISQLYNNYRLSEHMINVIWVNSFKLDIDDLYQGNGGEANIKGPLVNIFGKEFNMFEIPLNIMPRLFNDMDLAYDRETQTYKVLFYPGGDDVKRKKSHDIFDATAPFWKEKYENMKKTLENSSLAIEWDDEFKCPGKFLVDGDFSAGGFLELKASGDKIQILSGGVMMKISGGFSSGFPCPAAPYIFVSYGVTGELGTDAKLELVNASYVDPELKVSSDITAELTPYLGMGVGGRGIFSAETGFKGKFDAEFSLPVEKIEENLKVDFTAEVYILLCLFAFKAEYVEDFLNVRLYPNLGDVELMSIDYNDLELIERDYLEGDVSLMSYDENTVKTNAYPYGGIKSAKLSDGRTVLVWLDDDTERDLLNKTALYYTISENGAIGDIKQIQNDGTPDFDFDLSENGDKVSIVWQNGKAELSDSATLNEMAANTELSYCEFDGTQWGDVISITEGNSDYEYSPSVLNDGAKAHIIWTQNLENNPVPGTSDASESIYYTTVSGGVVSEKTLKYENMPLIYESEVNDLGSVACIADKDGDFTTGEDRILYVDGSVIYDNSTKISGLHLGRDNNFIFTEESVLKYYFKDGYNGRVIYTLNDTINGADKIKYVGSDSNNYAYVYEVQDGFASNLYALYKGAKNPVQITDFDEKMRSWDVTMNSDGELEIAALLATVDVDGEKLNNTARIIYTGATVIEDISVVDFCADNSLAPGGSAEFSINVYNGTKNNLSSIDVKIEGEKSGVLYEKTISQTLTAGEVTRVSITDCTLPADFTEQNITVTISNSSIAEDEKNNSCTKLLGKANLSVKITAYDVTSNGTARLTVKNEGGVDAENVELIVKCGDDVVYEESIDKISAVDEYFKELPIDEKYYNFEKGYEKYSLKAEVTCDTDEEYLYDNSDAFVIEKEKNAQIKLNCDSVVLKPGESFKPEVHVTNGDNIKIYYSSGNTNVATVSDDGTITAVANGTVNVHYMSPDAPLSESISVYVRDTGTPVVSNATYKSNYVRAAVSLDNSLAAGENRKVIVAIYGRGGQLLAVEQTDSLNFTGSVIRYMSSSQFTGDMTPSKIKVMIWDSVDAMTPMSCVAESDITIPEN